LYRPLVMRRIVVLGVALLLVGGCSDDPSPPRLSVGIVDSETGDPAAEVRLVVESLDPEVGEVARGFTDDGGSWAVVLPEPGRYAVDDIQPADDQECWWDIPRTEVEVAEGATRVEFQGIRVCR
jgi:hypothetical protein